MPFKRIRTSVPAPQTEAPIASPSSDLAIPFEAPQSQTLQPKTLEATPQAPPNRPSILEVLTQHGGGTDPSQAVQKKDQLDHGATSYGVTSETLTPGSTHIRQMPGGASHQRLSVAATHPLVPSVAPVAPPIQAKLAPTPAGDHSPDQQIDQQVGDGHQLTEQPGLQRNQDATHPPPPVIDPLEPGSTDLRLRLPSQQKSLASGRALGQPINVVQRSDTHRIHRCGGSGKEAEQSAPLSANEILLSSDPAYAKTSFLGWFRDKIKAKVEAWNLTFDPSAIQCKSVLLNDVATPAIVLTWNAEWGDKPTSTDIPFSMQPVDARAAVAAVKKLAGWGKMTVEDQGMLENMLKGESNAVSAAARVRLQGMLATLASQTDVEQAKALTGLISAKESLPSVVNEAVTTVAVKYELEGPTTEKDYQFRGKKADAEKWIVKFEDGVSLTIIAPKAPEKGYHNHTVQKAAESASYLPKSNRSAINTILLNVVVNPDDAHWAVEYKTPDFHSYMTAGKSGIVTIYPNAEAKPLPSDNYMRGTMIHETGHTWSYKTWGTDTKAGKWVDWKQAMDKDKVSVSGYAMASISEDVAETIQVYSSTQGSPKFAEYRQIVPNRFQILDTEYK